MPPSSLLSAKLNAVQMSPTIGITQLAADLRRQGHDVISLSQGEPDFDTPDHVKAAAKAAIDAGMTKYTDVDGTPELKDAIVGKFRRENDLRYERSQISVGTGGKQVLFNALFASLDPGDEVIIPAPYWVSYPDIVRLVGAVPVIVPCPESQGFRMTASQLRAAITARTKWLIVNSPSNPTGARYSAAELRELAGVLLDHPRVHVMTDDIYEHIRYDGCEFSTIAAVDPRLYDRTLTCNGLSKAYAMTGWRIGYAGGPPALIRAMAVIQSQSTTNPSSVSQAAAVAALTGSLGFLKDHMATFTQRRDMCVKLLNAIPGVSCGAPEGAFYLYPSCKGLIGARTSSGQVLQSDTDVAAFLMQQAHVAVVPGAAFGMSPFFRISFATSTERLRTACDRMSAACKTLDNVTG
jgi:aspartate aminotransferase